MTDNVFQPADPQTPTEEPVNNAAPSVPEELTDLIGEGRKYKSMDDALRSIPHAQTHISRLEQELSELKEDLGKRMNAEEALNKILEARKSSDVQEHPPADITPDALKDLVKSTYKEISDDEKKAHNITEVSKRVIAAWGDKANATLDSKAAELGVSVAFLQDTASHSPQAFYNLIGLNSVPKQENPSARQSSVNTAGFEGTGMVQPYSYKWYQQMRKDDPKAYYMPKVQLEMHRRAAEQGDDFYK